MDRKKCTFFTSNDYKNILVEYQGDIIAELDTIDYACGAKLTDRYAILAVRKDMVSTFDKKLKTVIYAEKTVTYTLEEISPIESNGILKAQVSPYLNLTGAGTLIGIIDTGIDYLNEEFMYEDGTTRIESIWDQNIEGESAVEAVVFGTLYTRDDINRAIQASKKGEDPYAILPSKDTIGHGTHMAGIIGARGKNSEIKSAAPECEFVIVKLIQSNIAFDFPLDVPIYSVSQLVIAVNFLAYKAKNLNKPMVIFLPLGSNFGAHDGTSILEAYLQSITDIKNVVCVTGSGNEGNQEVHASGYIKNVGGISDIELKIGQGEIDFELSIWIRMPNKMGISITSPTGEIIDTISPKVNQQKLIKFVLEDTTIQLSIFYPEEHSGSELIVAKFIKPSEGIWKLTLIGEIIVDGRYDAWLPQRLLLNGDTRFLNPDPYTTVTLPGTLTSVICVAFYDQNNNSVVAASGLGYTTNNVVKPGIAAGGVNVATTDLNKGVVSISGSSAAAAVVAGACLLILQWGVVYGNDTNMSTNKVRTYLIRGVTKRPGDVYPNREWGYGQLNLYGIFEGLRGTYTYTDESNYRTILKGNIMIRYNKNIF
jgi:subtilisin family serine protease